jgi:hypothetical protein
MPIDRISSENSTWDPRLITRDRAANLCGTWRLTVHNEQPDVVFFRCTICDGNVMMLPQGGKQVDVDSIIAQTLGHMVKCHNFSLSGGEQRGTDK